MNLNKFIILPTCCLLSAIQACGGDFEKEDQQQLDATHASALLTAGTTTVCSGLKAGTYTPGPNTTGVKKGSKLKVHYGDIKITVDGTVIKNMDVRGFITVAAKNVKILNSIVRGGKSDRGWALILADDPRVKNLYIEGVELVPTNPSRKFTGVLGHDYTAKCVNVYRTTDGFGVYNRFAPGAATNVLITQSFCHELAYFASKSDHSDRTHNDCIQIQGGSGTQIRANMLHASYSNVAGTQNHKEWQAMSAIMLNYNPKVGKTTNIIIADNLISGGLVGINGRDSRFAKYSRSDWLGWIGRNVFVNNQYYRGKAITLHSNLRNKVGFKSNSYNDGTPLVVEYFKK